EPIAEVETSRLRLQRLTQRPLPEQEELRLRPLVQYLTRRIDEVLVALRIVQPRDGPHDYVVRADAEFPSNHFSLFDTPLARELVERRTQVDDLHALGPHEPGAPDEL